MKIGVFSGSFDPIHCGHGMMANYLGQYCGFDQVWLMPSPLNPLKSGDTPPASYDDRLEMCKIAVASCSNVVVSDFERNLSLPTFTYVTLDTLRNRFPGKDFELIVGSDNWLCFDRWRDSDKIIAEFGVTVYPRPGYEVTGPLPANVRLLHEAPLALISSTFVRKAVGENRNLAYFLDSGVQKYIAENNLYARTNIKE